MPGTHLDYIIVKARAVEDLEKKVCAYLNSRSGWIVQGGLATDENWYYQAIVRINL